jgi:uncharacterized protein YjbI with pentapeptide repeats
MTNFIKSKVQQSLSFLLMLVVAFSAFSGVLFVDPSPSYAFDQVALSRALKGYKNLVGADLSGADLSGADLLRADLLRADLLRADLSGADLSLANLRRADLSAADLSRANLRRADLSGADLSGADLSFANLSGANLRMAIANSSTKFLDDFDAVSKGVIFREE